MSESSPKVVVKTVGPKVPTAADAAKHKAGGGNVKITNAVSIHEFIHRYVDFKSLNQP